MAFTESISMMVDSPIVGIELGGTKTIVTFAMGKLIVKQTSFLTGTDPQDTMERIAEVIETLKVSGVTFKAIGISSFGPIVLDRTKQEYGHIGITPKQGWSGFDVRGFFARRFGGPIGFDTDVNGAAMAEGLWGSAVGCNSLVYLTIGTGIGGGFVENGVPRHGLFHPEMGHLLVRRRRGDRFAGTCPFHGDCLEGLASGPAIAARTGAVPTTLTKSDPVWDRIADEIGQLASALMLLLSPDKIVIGGGVVMGNLHLLPKIRAAVHRQLAGYVGQLSRNDWDGLIVPPSLGNDAGPLGSIAVGLRTFAHTERN